MNSPHSRILFIYSHDDLQVHASVRSSSVLFQEAGYRVETGFFPSPGRWAVEGDGLGDEIRSMAPAEDVIEKLFGGMRDTIRRFPVIHRVTRMIKRAISRLLEALAWWWFLLQASRRHTALPYRCVIGVDARALDVAARIATHLQAPYVYFAFEFLVSSDIRDGSLTAMKKLETRLSRDAALVVVHGEDRGRLLIEDNSLKPERVISVPHSPLGKARRSQSRFWHERFDLDPDVRVVLYTGGFWKFAALEDIAETVHAWPPGWVFVAHTPFEDDASTIRKLRDTTRVYVSCDRFNERVYIDAVDGGDIGLAFYVPVEGDSWGQDNVRVLGLGSGKTNCYLRSGLPVIVNSQSSLGALIKEWDCGVVVDSAHEIGRSISMIRSEYDRLSTAACRAFDEHLEFRRGFDPALRRIESLT